MLTINGAEMPSPSEMTVTLEDRGETSAIHALGQRVADRMAVKRVVHLTWALLTGGELAKLVSAVNAGVFFTAALPDPAGGTFSGVFRAEERSAQLHRADGALIQWKNVTMQWEER